MAERERTLQEELQRIYGNNKRKNQPKPAVTIKGITRPAETSQIRKQIEKVRNP